MSLKIVRLEETKQGALGVLIFNRIYLCSTLEPDDDDPVRNQIPTGVYKVIPFSGTRFKDTYEIIVPDHTAVLFHSGNTEEDTTMCVLLGQYPGKLREERAVKNSGITFDKFMTLMKGYHPDGCMAEFINLY